MYFNSICAETRPSLAITPEPNITIAGRTYRIVAEQHIIIRSGPTTLLSEEDVIRHDYIVRRLNGDTLYTVSIYTRTSEDGIEPNIVATGPLVRIGTLK